MFLHVPLSVINPLEKEFRAFLWGHWTDHHGFHWVVWAQVCLPKNEGGLDIVPLWTRRFQCLCKHAAQLLLHPDILWAKLVHAKYKFSRSWLNYSAPQNVSPIWHKIFGAANYVQFQVQWLKGKGQYINVYLDPWISIQPLISILAFLNIDTQRMESKITDLINSNRHWNVEKLNQLFSGRGNCKSNHDYPYCLWPLDWSAGLGKRKLLEVSLKDMSNLSIQLWCSSWISVQPCFRIWRLNTSPWVRLFWWQLSWNQWPSKEYFVHCSILYGNLLYCDLHSDVIESDSHIVLYCLIARQC